MADAGNNKDLLKNIPESVQQILDKQEQLGKMLIRRDLALTRANERLRELDEMKTDFVSTATHQMRTPLSGIKWVLGMIMNGDFGPITDDQEKYLKKAYISIEHMIELIRDMLLVDQIESGTLYTSSIEHTHIVELMDNIVTEASKLASDRKVELKFVHGKDECPPAKISPDYLRVVLLLKHVAQNFIVFYQQYFLCHKNLLIFFCCW